MTRVKLMERKGGRGSPKGRLPREVTEIEGVEVGGNGDGNVGGSEDTAIGVVARTDNEQIENVRYLRNLK